MRTIGVIPSRWGSTRFPGKSLAPICGRPLVAWVAEAVRRARGLDEVIVATDDDRIADAARACGVTVAMTPSDLPSGTDRVAAAANPGDDDIVINIQGDEPLIDPAIVSAVAAALAGDADAAARRGRRALPGGEHRAELQRNRDCAHCKPSA